MGEVIPFERNPRSAGNVSANLAAEKKETWGSAIRNSLLLNIPALGRANRGEKPRIFTVKNTLADVGGGALWFAVGGIPAVVTGAAIGTAAIVQYNRKKKAA
jgi:hypothetical protein